MSAPERMDGSAIPAFVNATAGSAKAAADALAADSRFELREIQPDALAAAVRLEAERGTRRILVSGGDGTIATAAAAVVGTGVELAILPGGTLNHFAKDLGIPTETEAALDTAAGVSTRTADVGFVNDRLFLNTSSVGAYVLFVRTRERIEPHFGYYFGSLLAAARIFAGLRSFYVELEVEGEVRRYRSPLVFLGLGERELMRPGLGMRVENGRRGLHLIVVSGRRRARLMVLALAAAARGIRALVRTPHVDSFLVDRCTIELPRPLGNVAIDGEIVLLRAPLRYRLVRDAIIVVAPAGTAASITSDTRQPA